MHIIPTVLVDVSKVNKVWKNKQSVFVKKFVVKQISQANVLTKPQGTRRYLSQSVI